MDKKEIFGTSADSLFQIEGESKILEQITKELIVDKEIVLICNQCGILLIVSFEVAKKDLDLFKIEVPKGTKCALHYEKECIYCRSFFKGRKAPILENLE